jgi:hypothetical protein
MDHTRLPHMVDIHPRKQGRFVPCTAQQVIAPRDMPQGRGRERAPMVLVMNPNYVEEVRRTLNGLGLAAETRTLEGRSSLALHC